MPKVTRLTDEQLKWLAEVHERYSFVAMANHIGCHVDTLKRILAREGLREFDGAKYTPAAKIDEWDRPCIQCGSTERRPKNWFMCSDCRRRAGYEEH